MVNSCDDSVNKKYDQLIKLGFKDVYSIEVDYSNGFY